MFTLQCNGPYVWVVLGLFHQAHSIAAMPYDYTTVQRNVCRVVLGLFHEAHSIAPMSYVYTTVQWTVCRVVLGLLSNGFGPQVKDTGCATHILLRYLLTYHRKIILS